MVATNNEHRWHRFGFPRTTRLRHFQALLQLATFAVEGLCGDAATHAVQCRIGHFSQSISIDVSTHAGRVLAAIFRAFVRREYGDGGLIEDRLLPPPLESI